jgi:hypothetical protein
MVRQGLADELGGMEYLCLQEQVVYQLINFLKAENLAAGRWRKKLRKLIFSL